MTTHTQESLVDIQIKLEEQMTQKGIDRYMKAVSTAKQHGEEDGLDAALLLMKRHTQTMADAIQVWLDETSKGRAGNNNIAYKYLKDKDPSEVAYVALKKLLGRVSTPSMVQKVAREVGTAIEDEIHLDQVRKDEAKAYQRIVRGVRLRISDRHRRTYALRTAGHHIEFDTWPEVDRTRVGLKLIDIAIETLGWFTVETQMIGKHNTPKFLVGSATLVAQLEKHHGLTASLRPVYEPMVVQPRDWTTPNDGGYLTSNVRPLKMVKVNSRGYYEELEHTEMPVVYASVNALQRTAWQVNTQVLRVLEQFWETGNPIAGLPARDGADIPSKPFDIETNPDSLLEWRKRAAKVYQTNTQERSKRLSVVFTLDVANRYNDYPRLFMPYQLDFRGRIYAVPSFNPQGPDHMKALLRFAGGKPLGTHGAQWLAMHGANVAGNDKVGLEDRARWVLDNQEEILAIAEDPYTYRGWTDHVGDQKIDKPWQFLAFCFEWAGYVEHGEAFVSKIPIALDGSCSGLQHFSAMLRDEVGGEAVNLIPSDTPKDVYGIVMGKVIATLEGIVAPGVSPEGEDEARDYTHATQWLAFGLNRKVTKRPVMTLSYGSKQYGFRKQLMADTVEPRLKVSYDERMNIDRALFPFDGDGYVAAGFMAAQIWTSVTTTLVKSVAAMDWLQLAAVAVSGEGLPIRWSSPVGFPILQAYWDVRDMTIRTTLNGKIVKLSLPQKIDKLDRKAQTNGIAPNFVHSCDAAHMMLTTVRAEQEGIHSFAMIHDSFGTTAAQTEDLFRIVREAFVEMYTDVDVLEQFRRDIERQLGDDAEELPPLPERGTLELKDVLKSRFCFA